MAITTLLGLGRRDRPGKPPLATLAARTAGASVGLLALLALAGAQVRVLPWLIDPRVPWRVAVPFARAVASVALEAAVLVGWPIGWALATFVLIERGEARVLAMLGERPLRTTLGLLPPALAFSAVLAVASLAGGRDASEPGRVLADLLHAGRASCAPAAAPRAVDVPLLGAAWLCDEAPTLVGHPPLSRGSDALYSARALDVAPDARRIDVDDVVIAVPRADATVKVKHAVFRLPPFVRASSLPAPWRAVFLATSGVGSALLAVWLLLAMDERALVLWRLHALLVGAAGPVAALAFLHALEAHEKNGQMPLGLPPLLCYGALPFVATATTLSAAALVTRLPGVRVTASRHGKGRRPANRAKPTDPRED
jgi:hypothetical protein